MKKGKLRIYLFRHGQTTYNRDGRFTGSIDAKLTPKGRKHAKIIAKKLKNKKFQAAIHTSLSRSIDTLKPVLKNHPECVLILQDDRMTERNYGSLQGMLHDTFIDKIGSQEYKLRVQGDSFTDIDNNKQKNKIKDFLGKQEYDAIHRGYNVRPPKGESFADVEVRVKKFIKDLKKFMKKNKVNVAISAHGNSIRIFRKVMEKTTKEKATKWSIPYDKVFTYEI